jgi:hypothetical protein
MVELVETFCRLNFFIVAFHHESNEVLYSVGFLFARLVLVSRLRILLSPYHPKSHVISFHAGLLEFRSERGAIYISVSTTSAQRQAPSDAQTGGIHRKQTNLYWQYLALPAQLLDPWWRSNFL